MSDEKHEPRQTKVRGAVDRFIDKYDIPELKDYIENVASHERKSGKRKSGRVLPPDHIVLVAYNQFKIFEQQLDPTSLDQKKLKKRDKDFGDLMIELGEIRVLGERSLDFDVKGKLTQRQRRLSSLSRDDAEKELNRIKRKNIRRDKREKFQEKIKEKIIGKKK